MTSPAAGPLRLARALVVGAVVLALAAGAHLMGGGVLPAPTVLALLGGMVLAAAVAVAGRRLSVVELGALLGGGQLALHTAFGLLATSTLCTTSSAGGAGGAHAHHGAAATVRCTTTQAAASGATPVDGLLPGLGSAPTMLVLHVLATCATGLVLLHGERTLWWLAVWLRPLVALPALSAEDPTGSVPVPSAEPTGLRGPQHRRGVPELRGPPLGLAPTDPTW